MAIRMRLVLVLLGVASLAGCGVRALIGDVLLGLVNPEPTGPTQFVELADEPASDMVGAARAATCVGLGNPDELNHQQMLAQLNAYRQQNGLNTLAYSKTLEAAASGHALRMAQQGYFSHAAPDGSTPGDRAVAAGYCSNFVGENIAYGLNSLRTAEVAVNNLKQSPEHNTNMLDDRWDYVGVGYAKIETFGRVETWWVQLFGAKPDQP